MLLKKWKRAAFEAKRRWLYIAAGAAATVRRLGNL